MAWEKADHLGLSLPKMVSRLRSGDAELLGVVLSTLVGAVTLLRGETPQNIWRKHDLRLRIIGNDVPEN